MTNKNINIYEKLSMIQQELKAPKTQYNNFGKYSYRNAEDILEAVKPLTTKYRVTLVIKDEIKYIEGRFYVVAIATIYDWDNTDKTDNYYIEATAAARETETKKGMDESQITGAASSYARKYALNGLFAIDDTKDADTINTHGKQGNVASRRSKGSDDKLITEPQKKRLYAIANGKNHIAKNVLKHYGYESSNDVKMKDYDEICSEIDNAVR